MNSQTELVSNRTPSISGNRIQGSFMECLGSMGSKFQGHDNPPKGKSCKERTCTNVLQFLLQTSVSP